MSRSSRDPGGKPEAAVPKSLYPDVPYPFIVSFDPVPPGIRSAMRTVDPVDRVGHARKQEASPYFLVERAAAAIEQIELATRKKAFGNRGTQLFFHEGRNEATGESGILARRLIGPGLYTPPLAELLAPTGKLTEDARGAADRFRRYAAARQLLIFIFKDAGKGFRRPAAFAAIESPEEPGSSRVLARLLVAPFEISQWSDPELVPSDGLVN